MNPDLAFVAQLDDRGIPIALGQDRLTVKARGADTGGAYALLEFITMPGSGAPLHRHHHEDEAFAIISGTMTFQLGETELHAGPGSYILIPRGLRHAFRNRTDAPVHSLIIASPAGIEDYFMALSHLTALPQTQVTPEAINELNRRYGLEF